MLKVCEPLENKIDNFLVTIAFIIIFFFSKVIVLQRRTVKAISLCFIWANQGCLFANFLDEGKLQKIFK